MLLLVPLARLLPALFLGLIAGLPPAAAAPALPDAPRGRFLELHSCEVFAGPCVVNSEVDQAGNYLLRAWQFEQGSIAGVDLRGLSFALLEKADGGQTLAVAGHPASEAVVYLPSGLSPAQHAALLCVAQRCTQVRLDDSRVKTVPLEIDISGTKVNFSAGSQIAFDGAAPEPCPAGGCGEMLWYSPRTRASSYVVDELGKSSITEPRLGLHWMDHGRRTLFVGSFGYPTFNVPGICGAPYTAAR